MANLKSQNCANAKKKEWARSPDP